MKSKTVLVTSLAAATLGLVSFVDTAGVLPFSAKTVHAEITRTENHEVKSKITPGSENEKIYVDMTVQSVPGSSYAYIRADLINKNTGQIAKKEALGRRFDAASVPRTVQDSTTLSSVPDGEYYLKFYSEDELTSKTLHIFSGISATFTVKDGKYVNPLETSNKPKTPKQEKPKQEKPTPTPTPTVQSGWSGNSYYQNGQKVINKWVFDVHYNSYYFINVNGNYIQNAWSGNYYLKSNGKMAKSEWIYDKNYGSYYYLTAEGSYARNTWVGNYYLKSNGKMAKGEWIYDKNYGSYYYLTSEGSYARNAWSGSYYLKSNGKMAKGEWVYDSNYKSYYYLTAEGSYARNTWVGNYYLKSNGKMAKGEWIYDKNYGSYYYLTSEGSYARGTWVGDYYLKSNGKMAVNERTPDGYQVDGSGKWIRSQGPTSTSSSSQATSLGISLYHVNDAMTYIDIALPSTPSSSYKVAYDFALVDVNTGKISTQTNFTVTYNPSLRAFQTRHFFSATPDGSYRFVIKGKGQDGKVYDGQSVVFRVKNHRFIR